jgi:hypothetical protein
MSDGEGFLSRWSRLKQEGPPTDQNAPSVAPGGDGDAAASAAPTPGEAAGGEAAFDLPAIETLTGASDFSAFMRPGVPDALRVAALRRLWAIDPAIRDFIGDARDYGWDWHVPGGVPGSGPLLPTDDVKRLLARILGDPPEQAKRTDAAAGTADADDAAAGGPPAAPAPVAAVAAASEAEPPAADVAPQQAPRADPEPVRVRRHGGAVPR